MLFEQTVHLLLGRKDYPFQHAFLGLVNDPVHDGHLVFQLGEIDEHHAGQLSDHISNHPHNPSYTIDLRSVRALHLLLRLFALAASISAYIIRQFLHMKAIP